MAKIFISHSSKDKKFVFELGKDLRELGHEPWLDEWEIKVGDCIPSKIDQAIGEADYVIVVLSPDAVNSGWVEREWQSKYWDEINKNKTLVLPILISDCQIPDLLKTKKYADFRNDYQVGFADLIAAITPVSESPSPNIEIQQKPETTDISNLISEVQLRTTSLAKCLAKALVLAQKYNFGNLELFCRYELEGWKRDNVVKYPQDASKHRLIEVFFAPFAELNLQYWGWGNNSSTVFDFIKRNTQDFFLIKMIYPESISRIESLIEQSSPLHKNILTMHCLTHEVIPDSPIPDHPVRLYTKPSNLLGILDATRSELTKKLLGCVDIGK